MEFDSNLARGGCRALSCTLNLISRAPKHYCGRRSCYYYYLIIIIAQLLNALTTSAYYPAQEKTMSSYNYLSFQRKVQAALESVERVLELERKPRLADEIDHTYGAKYGLVNLTSNVAIIAFMNCLKRLGLDTEVLKSIDKTKPATLEFESSTSPIFLKEVTVDVRFFVYC